MARRLSFLWRGGGGAIRRQMSKICSLFVVSRGRSRSRSRSRRRRGRRRGNRSHSTAQHDTASRPYQIPHTTPSRQVVLPSTIIKTTSLLFGETDHRFSCPQALHLIRLQISSTKSTPCSRLFILLSSSFLLLRLRIVDSISMLNSLMVSASSQQIGHRTLLPSGAGQVRTWANLLYGSLQVLTAEQSTTSPSRL